jgi:hypothetical protein
LLGASRIFPLVAVLFPGVEKRVLLEFCFCRKVYVAADDKKSLMPLPAMCSVSPVYNEFIGARKKMFA